MVVVEGGDEGVAKMRGGRGRTHQNGTADTHLMLLRSRKLNPLPQICGQVINSSVRNLWSGDK